MGGDTAIAVGASSICGGLVLRVLLLVSVAGRVVIWLSTVVRRVLTRRCRSSLRDWFSRTDSLLQGSVLRVVRLYSRPQVWVVDEAEEEVAPRRL